MYSIRKYSPGEKLKKIPGMALFSKFNNDRKFLIAVKDDILVGVICYNQNSGMKIDAAPNLMGLGFIDVAPGYKNQGIATALMKAFYEEAKLLEKNVYITAYEPEGWLYLKPIVKSLATEYSMITVEHDEYVKNYFSQYDN